MKRFALLMLLAAGAAGAQTGTTNCRSSAYVCSAAAFISNSQVTYGSVGANIHALDFTGATRFAVWIDRRVTTQRGICLAGNVTTGSCLNELMVDGTGAATFSSTVTSGVSSGSNAYTMGTGAWFDLGGGGNDRIKSDGTNVLVDTHYAPNADQTSTLGTANNAWLRGYFNAGVQLDRGDVVKWTTAPISDNTTLESQVAFNDSVQEPFYGTDVRKYNPVGQGREWVVEKRVQVADLGFENTNCPLANPGLKSTGAAGVTYSCTDAAAAGQNTQSGESFRILNTTAAASSISIINTSANVTKRELGPRYLQRASVPTGSSTNVRHWIALVPQATSLTGVDTGAISIAGFRYSTVAGDTAWQACTGDGTTTTCTSTGVAMTVDTNHLFEVDCREQTNCVFFINGSLVVRKTSNLPGATTQLAPRASVEATSAAARALWYGRSAVQTN